MSRHCRLFFLIMLFGGWAHADVSDKQAAVEKQLRQLEKDIEQVRELKFKKPVVAQVIPRPKQGAEGIQGYYDPKKKALFLYDDIKDNYARGVLIHEMVHALQDQHFGLAKLHAATFGSDRELALAALIEGDATYTMIELMQKENPHVGKMLATDLSKAKNLQNAFLYGLGARYVQTLKQRGGWKAVNARYPFPPTSTAVILQPEKRISPVQLGPGKTIGAFGLIRLLHQEPTTAAQAVEAVEGWRGDRVVVDQGKEYLWVGAFDNQKNARRFFELLNQWEQKQHPAFQPLQNEKQGQVRQAKDGSRRAVLLRGTRVWRIACPDEKTFRALLDRVEGPPALLIYSKQDRKLISFGELIDRLLEADLICVGETHDSEAHHLVQYMILKALFARDERLGVGMEMFQRPFQKVADAYILGAINESTFLTDTEYAKRWRYDWALYKPIVDFCRRNRIPLAALNLSEELRGKLSKLGYDKLSLDEKKELGEIDFHVKEHRQHWFDKLGEMHGQGEMSKENKEKMYQVMTAWDEYMADSAARFQRERKLRRMVILAGSGHIERGFGIPQRAAKRTGGKVLTVTTRLGGDVSKVSADPVADFILIVQ